MKPPRTITGFLLSLALAFAALPAWGGEPLPRPEAQRAALAAARSQGIQTEFPAPKASRRLEPFPPPEARPKDLPSVKPDSLRFILWVSVILIVVIVLMNIKDNVWSDSRSRRLRLKEEDTAPETTARRMSEAREAADGIADSGGFAEAMHLLLLQSVNEFRRRLDVMFADSLTSREILRSIQAPPEARAAFAEIISRVELSYFGAREPDKDAYEACRRSYELLTASLKNAHSRENPA